MVSATEKAQKELTNKSRGKNSVYQIVVSGFG